MSNNNYNGGGGHPDWYYGSSGRRDDDTYNNERVRGYHPSSSRPVQVLEPPDRYDYGRPSSSRDPYSYQDSSYRRYDDYNYPPPPPPLNPRAAQLYAPPRSHNSIPPPPPPPPPPRPSLQHQPILPQPPPPPVEYERRLPQSNYTARKFSVPHNPLPRSTTPSTSSYGSGFVDANPRVPATPYETTTKSSSVGRGKAQTLPAWMTTATAPSSRRLVQPNHHKQPTTTMTTTIPKPTQQPAKAQIRPRVRLVTFLSAIGDQADLPAWLVPYDPNDSDKRPTNHGRVVQGMDLLATRAKDERSNGTTASFGGESSSDCTIPTSNQKTTINGRSQPPSNVPPPLPTQPVAWAERTPFSVDGVVVGPTTTTNDTSASTTLPKTGAFEAVATVQAKEKTPLLLQGNDRPNGVIAAATNDTALENATPSVDMVFSFARSSKPPPVWAPKQHPNASLVVPPTLPSATAKTSLFNSTTSRSKKRKQRRRNRRSNKTRQQQERFAQVTKCGMLLERVLLKDQNLDEVQYLLSELIAMNRGNAVYSLTDAARKDTSLECHFASLQLLATAVVNGEERALDATEHYRSLFSVSGKAATKNETASATENAVTVNEKTRSDSSDSVLEAPIADPADTVEPPSKKQRRGDDPESNSATSKALINDPPTTETQRNEFPEFAVRTNGCKDGVVVKPIDSTTCTKPEVLTECDDEMQQVSPETAENNPPPRLVPAKTGGKKAALAAAKGQLRKALLRKKLALEEKRSVGQSAKQSTDTRVTRRVPAIRPITALQNDSLENLKICNVNSDPPEKTRFYNITLRESDEESTEQDDDESENGDSTQKPKLKKAPPLDLQQSMARLSRNLEAAKEALCNSVPSDEPKLSKKELLERKRAAELKRKTSHLTNVLSKQRRLLSEQEAELKKTQTDIQECENELEAANVELQEIEQSIPVLEIQKEHVNALTVAQVKNLIQMRQQLHALREDGNASFDAMEGDGA